ncbi:hypothetical protein SLEP1_g53500 [Rubroshorea leprosula]|uniref:cysteine--tRNA ligase n=1 Tax=Rubroshorea leprosula TaxID=152421 RepID=A0AAV5MD48_9ROSI|nr:hypothetical protein SLEP1_g53500 [Rubroshorea leprosula]
MAAGTEEGTPNQQTMVLDMEEKNKFKVYNTMTNQKEVFTPKVPGKVGMYVCGVTAYDLSHLGHARAAVSFDILFRYLLHLGYEVTYVRNFTDLDDKVIRRANESGENPLALSSRFCKEYMKDMNDLQCLPPTHQPRVSDHMEQIKDMIIQIINNDYAYVVDGDVFFAVEKFPDYGKLSGQVVENHRAGERVAIDLRKRNPADFALWKAAKPGEPSWDSPWGPGRPGWHIECSAMSVHYLSSQFDIHGGATDLKFPHHENEIAQSCAASQESNVSYWVHNGHVTINKEKMSKSLGNFFTIRQITERYHPLALRYFLISQSYDSDLSFSVNQLEIASDKVFYIYQFVARYHKPVSSFDAMSQNSILTYSIVVQTLSDCEDALSSFQQGSLKDATKQNEESAQITAEAQFCIRKLHSEFNDKMSDNLDTSTILKGVLQEVLKLANDSLTKLKDAKQQLQLSLVQSLVEVEREVKEVLQILGLLPQCTYAEVLQQLKDKALKRAGLGEDQLLDVIKERAEARKNKDFTKGDQIRDELKAKGIGLMDIKGADTIWRPCVPPENKMENQ